MERDTRSGGRGVVREHPAKGNARRVLDLLPGESELEMCPTCGNPGDTVARRTYSNGSEHVELLCWACRSRVKNVSKARVRVPIEALPVRTVRTNEQAAGETVPLFGGGR